MVVLMLERSDVPDAPDHYTGRTLGELMAKKENPMKSLIKSGVAIKMVIGDNSKIQNLMDKVNKKNKELLKPNIPTSLATKSSKELEDVEAMLLNQIKIDREAAAAMGQQLQI